MGKPRLRSVLYRLIEAGQLARHALLVPLEARGLEPGDDAVLLLLRDRQAVTGTDIGVALETSEAGLEPRLRRLVARGLVETRGESSRYAISADGECLRRELEKNWDRLEDALLGDLKPKKRKGLRKVLQRFVDLLEAGVRPNV